MNTDDKLRPIYLLKILKEHTDEEHYLSTTDLQEILESEYGITTFRTTVKNDVELLAKTGIGVQCIRSSKNMFNYIDSDFDTPELKLLIDAVLSSKFISQSKSKQLVSKLMSLSGPYESKELKRNLIIEDRIKHNNEKIFQIIDSINNAINTRKKIQFQMTEYNPKKKKILHNNGEVYTFSPYSLVWDGDYYYVVGYSDKYEKIGSHRVDRIYDVPIILDEKAVKKNKEFDLNKYINSMFHMYDAEREVIKLQVQNELMNAIIDKFGAKVRVTKCDDSSFYAYVLTAAGTLFYNWIFGFGGKVKIIEPDNVKDEYIKLLKKALKNQ